MKSNPSRNIFVKVRIFWEGHKSLRNLHFTLSYIVPVKSKVKILQNFAAFSERMNFNICRKKKSYKIVRSLGDSTYAYFMTIACVSWVCVCSTQSSCSSSSSRGARAPGGHTRAAAPVGAEEGKEGLQCSHASCLELCRNFQDHFLSSQEEKKLILLRKRCHFNFLEKKQCYYTLTTNPILGVKNCSVHI